MRHSVVWKVEQRSPNKVSNKLVFFCLTTGTLPERSFDAARARVLSHLCLIAMFIAHAGRKYLCLLFIHGLLNMWEGFMSILIQVLGPSIVLVLVLSFSFCSSLPVYCNIYLSCCILTWGQRNMRLLLGQWKSSFQRPCIKWFASGFAWEFRGYYTILFPEKLLLSLKRHFSLAGSHFFTSWYFVIAF